MSLRQRDPRQLDSPYKGWVATLPCVACIRLGLSLYRRFGVQVAHLRMADAAAGKRETGMAEKPSDVWVTPLCVMHHTNGRTAQHNMGEERFWAWLGIDPFALCRALYDAFEKGTAGYLVIAIYAAEGRKATGDLEPII